MIMRVDPIVGQRDFLIFLRYIGRAILSGIAHGASLYALILLLPVLSYGCAHAGDYVGATHGYVTLGMKQGFGEGGDKKKYYIIDEMTIISPGDPKPSVKDKLGLPDEIKTNIEGYEIWTYKNRNIKFFFEKERFREWVYLK